MKCPTDNATLVMSERHGIEIDYCPECRGVWLDRGELDKIIDRAGTPPTAAAQPAQAYDDARYRERDHREAQYGRPQYDEAPPYGQRPYKKKRENWLSELFD
ncbi:zf-TFIIB domain-containing protein [Leifsonia shinshuensis]|uniref:TFIIB-type zinc ribbon-containing protein n=1 Tax=Leifsonia shinshuensis TaxID=150026 RepID=UPI00285DF1FB|nr:zf-TFIIB domain-containing protein [Leifsonia shinshuensis]MDR6970377.1 Zn-finger nucleic acid-binding protein [Leifsonia shinshuensis]